MRNYSKTEIFADFVEQPNDQISFFSIFSKFLRVNCNIYRLVCETKVFDISQCARRTLLWCIFLFDVICFLREMERDRYYFHILDRSKRFPK